MEEEAQLSDHERACCEQRDVERYFPYGDDEIRALKASDPKLAPIIDEIEAQGHIHRALQGDLFQAVVNSIVGQQISTAAHKTVWKRMVDKLGDITPDSVDAASVDDMQSCGITFRKVDYIKEFASKVLSGEFDLDAVASMPDEQAIEALISLKGIGRWTAEMILLFCLERPDILSFGDLAIQRGMRMVYRHRVITPKLFAKYQRRLSPYGSTAALFFWEVSHGVISDLTDPAQKNRKPTRTSS